jgi:hypothetical protein
VTGEEDKDLADDGRLVQTVPTVVVTVQKGDTIHQILKGRFGKSGTILMGLVRKLNPEIEDLALIRVGQKIRLPLNLETADQIQPIYRRSDLAIEKMIGTPDEQSEEEVQREQTTESF